MVPDCVPSPGPVTGSTGRCRPRRTRLVGPRDPVRCRALGAADADGQSVSTVTMPFPVVAVILRGDDGSVGTVTCFMPAPVRARTS